VALVGASEGCLLLLALLPAHYCEVEASWAQLVYSYLVMSSSAAT
jgi:hypothetical protein